MSSDVDVGAQLLQAAAMIRPFGAVVVVGAGVSAAHYPMTAQLPPLLWHAIEDAPDALTELRARTRAIGSAKEILGSDPDRLDIGWQLVREFPHARAAFQVAFAALDADREPSSAHLDLARLINSGHVEAVVSYNWDTCLERAHERLYGVGLPAGLLHKPHGDAAHTEGMWVLPDEDGQVAAEVHDHIDRLSDRPRTLIVLGYSGSDLTVVESLLSPLEARWPVFRITPSAVGEGAIQLSADAALASFAAHLLPPQPLSGWKHVTFLRSRSFLAALRGERLRPTDVDACPELPAAPRLAERLLSSRYATLSGASGTGKSITAFHAARRLNREGWKVVELKQPGVASLADVEEFRVLSGPVLAVVDDAQAIDPGVLAEFESSADEDHAVLIASTERLEARDDETLVATQAVQVVHAYCRAHLDAVGPMLTQLDDRVRWSVFSDTPEQRLELALKTAAEPWLYMFIASGGERRITGALDRMVENGNAALLLAVICIAQMTSRDAGVTSVELASTLERYFNDRFCVDEKLQQRRVDDALLVLMDEKLIREHDGRIRAAHIRIAERVLQDLGRREPHAIGEAVRAFVRANLLDESIDTVGKFWLLRTFDRIDIYRFRWASSIVDDEVSESLLRQCIAAAPGRDRGVALNLLWSSEWLRKLSDHAASKLAEWMISWLPNLVSEEVSGFRWMLSGLRSDHEEAHRLLRASTSAQVLGERLSIAGSRWAAADWMHVIQELGPDLRSGTLLSWSEEFEAGINTDLLSGWLSNRDEHSHPFEIYELIDELASLAPRVAAVALDACGAEIQSAIENDIADAASNFSEWVFGTMWIVASLADAPTAHKHTEEYEREIDEVELQELDEARAAFLDARELGLRELAAKAHDVMSDVDWKAAAQSLQGKTKYQLYDLDLLLGWLSCLSTDITDQIADALSTDWVMRIVNEAQLEEGSDRNPFGAVDHLLYHVCWGDRGRAVVRAFLRDHEAEIEVFPAILVEPYPDLAAQWLRRGARVGLDAPRGSGWRQVTSQLRAVADVDRNAAICWLGQMSEDLVPSLSQPQKHDLNGIGGFIDLADDLNATDLDAVIGRLRAQAVRKVWQTRLQDAPDSMRTLLQRVSTTSGEIAALAEELLANTTAPRAPGSN
ncbi:SIR2 family protein [Marisediminicola antarctica]|uniref:SIR2-like domain-containing protein n=1 Tax=Marisediminicola antarctica TaxID=674079 RepID=A0A7L5AHR6_9MICO|nr:hypothetical protein [Marisediminicola antarctica]QHO70118.1 hypothetical protein BHD05_11175 [Marisediminicola antarctica]